MCGLAGCWSSVSVREEGLRAIAERMIAPIRHRGPDDSGVFVEPAVGLAMGFRRLAILDLSACGHQPMTSASGRYTITFNGEIYNFKELRHELESDGAAFRGQSDTEVMLAGFERWGVRRSIERFVGMFAFALWDSQARTLSLVRDRLGIKPMFVAYGQEGVSWGSELKALVAGPPFDRTLDIDALASYLRYLYVPAPSAIFRGSRKLLPGHMLTITDPNAPLPEPEAYWSAREAARKGVADAFDGTDVEAGDELERLLDEAVRLRMIADVPLGVLLSGGVDSSLVTALMRRHSTGPVRSYSIAFDDSDYDEAPYAAAVARHLRTQHTALLLTGGDALAVVPRLADMFDEPLADPSQIPTFLVSQLARSDVTVALSGDGGDELFGGYNRYTHGERLLRRMASLPRPVRHVAAAAISFLAPSAWDRLHGQVSPALPGGLRQRLPGEKLHKVGRLLAAEGPAAMYQSLLSAWQPPQRLLRAHSEQPDVVTQTMSDQVDLELVGRMMLADQLGYLPDDLLAKLDRASMAVSLEARVPILDHRVVEFSWRLPTHMKIRKGEGKWLLREVLHRHVPPALVDRPKMGFSVPIDRWLRGPLRDWAEALLTPARLRHEGILDVRAATAAWQSFQNGAGGGLMMWALVMFQAWHDRWGGS